MDAIKILGSLLSSGALSSGSGGNVLGTLLSSALGGGNSSGGGMGDVLGSLLGGGQQQRGGGMGDVLGSLLGGGQQQRGGGMGDVLGSLLGGGQQQHGGGMGDVLGSLLGGGQQQSGGGMGDLLGGLLGGGNSAGGAGLGGLLGGAVTKYMQSQNADVPDLSHHYLPAGADHAQLQEQAMLVIRAMINAAKADGKVDQQEQDKILAKLGDISPAEADFVRSEFNAPLNVPAFVNSIPRGMEQQIYAVSLMAIDLDTQTEAQYLNQLAQGLKISPEACNQLHAQVGAPQLYS